MEKDKSSFLKRIFGGLVFLAFFCLLLTNASCTYLRKSLTRKTLAPPVEAKGPIIAITMASAMDDKGHLVNPSFDFNQNEPQVTAIVDLGKIGSSQLSIAWYQISDDGDRKLFEHQIQVKSDDRAYSIGKNATKTLAAGMYKVVVSIDGQTQEMDWEVSLPKTVLSEERLSPASGEMDRVDSSPYQKAAMMRSALTNTGGNSNADNLSAAQGVPPEGGGSGSVPGFVSLSGMCIGGGDDESCGHNVTDSTGGIVNVFVYPNSEIFSLKCGQSQYWAQLDSGTGDSKYNNFRLPACVSQSDNGSPTDLPGSKFTFFVSNVSGSESDSTTITLGDDKAAPQLKVTSTPNRGAKVNAGDKIKIQVTASEKRDGASWQTGVKLIQITAEPGGLVKAPWTNSSNLPKPCEEKTWEQKDQATYTVPKNPPPIVKICVIAEDYAGNQGLKCAEFPTGDIWKGTMHSDVPATFGYPSTVYSCSSSFDATLKLSIAGGEIAGEGRAVYASTNCRHDTAPLCSEIPFKITGHAYSDRLELQFVFTELIPPKCVAWGFGAGYFVGQTLKIPITAPGVAEGQSNSSYDPDLATHYKTSDTASLKCETCAP